MALPSGVPELSSSPLALRIFGLTGGIGSGKSTVGRWFRERGVPVIDADQLARDVVAPGTQGLRAIADRFGSGVVAANGELDRKAVAAIVFEDPEARRALNAITHPLVGALFAETTALLDRRGEPLACYEVPLLFEVGLDQMISPIVVVAVPAEVQVERATRRDASTEDEARARIAAQLPLEEKVRRADYVIDNTGSLESTRARAFHVLEAICARFGIDPARYAASADLTRP